MWPILDQVCDRHSFPIVFHSRLFVTEDQTKIRVYGLVRWNPTLRAAIFEPTKNL